AGPVAGGPQPVPARSRRSGPTGRSDLRLAQPLPRLHLSGCHPSGAVALMLGGAAEWPDAGVSTTSQHDLRHNAHPAPHLRPSGVGLRSGPPPRPPPPRAPPCRRLTSPSGPTSPSHHTPL